MDLQLLNKIAVVTGSSRGLGFASAQALVQEGCRVAICARGEGRLNEAAAELRAKASATDQVLAMCQRPLASSN
jgi:3-oxoacyl-[acyl-carrier protein] reductase